MYIVAVVTPTIQLKNLSRPKGREAPMSDMKHIHI